jgi:hypothetical protein
MMEADEGPQVEPFSKCEPERCPKAESASANWLEEEQWLAGFPAGTSETFIWSWWRGANSGDGYAGRLQGPLSRTTPDVQLGQVWETRSTPKKAWRPVQVIKVVGDQIELQFLDLPGAPDDAERTFTVSAEVMATRSFRLPR